MGNKKQAFTINLQPSFLEIFLLGVELGVILSEQGYNSIAALDKARNDYTGKQRKQQVTAITNIRKGGK